MTGSKALHRSIWKPQKTSCDARHPAITQMVAPKTHISDVSCHYQAIIISSFEESACQSLWYAFRCFPGYTGFLRFSTGRVFDRLSHFQYESLPCLESVWLSLTAKQLSPCSIRERIKISWQAPLSFWIPCALGHRCAPNPAPRWESGKLMDVPCAFGNGMAWRWGISSRCRRPSTCKQIIPGFVHRTMF